MSSSRCRRLGLSFDLCDCLFLLLLAPADLGEEALGAVVINRDDSLLGFSFSVVSLGGGFIEVSPAVRPPRVRDDVTRSLPTVSLFWFAWRFLAATWNRPESCAMEGLVFGRV